MAPVVKELRVIPLQLGWSIHGRVGFLPEETYFFQDNGRNMVSSVFFHFLPEEMEEWDLR